MRQDESGGMPVCGEQGSGETRGLRRYRRENCIKQTTSGRSRFWACPDNYGWNVSHPCQLDCVVPSVSQSLILVVDDDVLERMGASYMFSDAGYRVLEAGSADIALRIFETNANIALLFTDVSMPGTINGADLARQVAERWPRVAILMTSGRPFPDGLPPAVRFHAKPYEPIEVLRDAQEMGIPHG